jgi:hypothetical protein
MQEIKVKNGTRKSEVSSDEDEEEDEPEVTTAAQPEVAGKAGKKSRFES